MYIARQAIFDRALNVYGYELLFRGSIHSGAFDGATAVEATATVLEGLFESGIQKITAGKKAFVNFNEALIHSDVVELIDKEKLVIEVLENVRVDQKLFDRISDLKEKGYEIALDDFEESFSSYPLVPLADIIKFDLLGTPLKNIRREVKMALAQNKILLAEKVETKEEFLKAKEMGFHLFQGYFFSKPSIVEKTERVGTTKAHYAGIIAELKKEEPSYQILAEIIGKDPKLSYRILRIISNRSGKSSVNSIKFALTYMGFKEIERWMHVLMMRELGEEKPQELLGLSLVRTKFAEQIAEKSSLKKYRNEAAMMGLFSTIDAILDQRMEDALFDIALAEEITEALLKQEGILSPVYRLMISYEQGNWEEAERLAEQLRIEEDALYYDYLEAISWAGEIMEKMYIE